MSLRDLELFLVEWVLIFEMNLVFIVPGQPQVILVHADGILVLKRDVKVPFSEFFWNLQVASLDNFVSGEFRRGSFWDIAFDGGSDVGCGLIREWIHFVFFDLHDAHDVVPLDGDLVRSTVLDENFAVLVFVNAD
jgi:hypothetical protein